MATAMSQDYIRLTAWALNRILSVEGSNPLELRMSDSVLLEHEGMLSKVNNNQGSSQSSHSSTSRVVYGGVSRRGGISSRSTHPMSSFTRNTTSEDSCFWGVVIEEDEPTASSCRFPAYHPTRPLLSTLGFSADRLGECRRNLHLPSNNTQTHSSVAQAFGQSSATVNHDYYRESGNNAADGKIQEHAYRGQRLADIIIKLKTVFGDGEQCQWLLKSQRSNSRIQYLIDLFQTLLDIPALETEFRNSLLTSAQRLAKSTDFHPTCSTVQNIKLVTNHPLAGGNFANIYKGIFGKDHVCVKVIRLYQPPQVSYFLQRLYPETILWGQLKHENILPFYGVYKLGTQLSLVSPWAENGDVTTFLKLNPHVNRAQLSLDVARGINCLHENGMIHGNLKGGNVLVHGSGRALVADFGLSAVTDPQILKWTSYSCANSKSGWIRWQAPELYGMDDGDSVNQTKASDIYALSCVFYEIFTGQIPFAECRMDSTVMHKVCLGMKPSRPSPSSPPWVNWGLTEALWVLMEDCWVSEPGVRPTIEQIVERLSWGVTGVDERPIMEEAISPSQFKRALDDNHFNWPTVEELETFLWATD